MDTLLLPQSPYVHNTFFMSNKGVCVCVHIHNIYIYLHVHGIDTGLLIIPVDILTILYQYHRTPLPNIDLALAPRGRMPAANA